MKKIVPNLAVLSVSLAMTVQPVLAQSLTSPSLVGATLERVVYPKPQPPQLAANDTPAVAASEEAVDPSVAQSVGCVIAGTVGTGISMFAGGENVVNIVAGGLVAPVNQVALYTAIAGVVFGTFCAVGQAVTPLYLYATKAPSPAPANKTVADSSCKLPKISSEPRRARDLLIQASLVTSDNASPIVERPDLDMTTPDGFRRRK